MEPKDGEIMRADNSIYVRVSSAEKQEFKQAAKAENLNLSQWLLKLARKQVALQKGEQ